MQDQLATIRYCGMRSSAVQNTEIHARRIAALRAEAEPRSQQKRMAANGQKQMFVEAKKNKVASD